MTWLSVYVDEGTKRRIRRAAKRADVSVSQWVRSRLLEALRSPWPAGYFDIFGSLRGSDVERPSQLPFDFDTPRERF